MKTEAGRHMTDTNKDVFGVPNSGVGPLRGYCGRLAIFPMAN